MKSTARMKNPRSHASADTGWSSWISPKKRSACASVTSFLNSVLLMCGSLLPEVDGGPPESVLAAAEQPELAALAETHHAALAQPLGQHRHRTPELLFRDGHVEHVQQLSLAHFVQLEALVRIL